MLRLVLRGVFVALAFTTIGCGGGDSSDPAASSSPQAAGSMRPSGNGACGLMMQGEVDELFGTGVGAGANETLEGGVEICSWPAGDEPSLLLQISAGGADIRAAVDLGAGYRVVDVEEMSGPAAVAVEEADGPETVLVFALDSGEKTVTISPVGLGVDASSPKFEALKALMDTIASRL